MILNDDWILQHGPAIIYPFNPEQVNPASYDLCWSGRYRVPIRGTFTKIDSIDTRTRTVDVWSPIYHTDRITICPGEFLLLDTLETFEFPGDTVGLLYLKSSMGRYGIEQVHAGFFDPGFGLRNPSTGTLEITNISPWRLGIYEGQRIVQMVFMQMNAAALEAYHLKGHYNGQVAPEGPR